MVSPARARLSGLGGTSGTVVVYAVNDHVALSRATNVSVTITGLVPYEIGDDN